MISRQVVSSLQTAQRSVKHVSRFRKKKLRPGTTDTHSFLGARSILMEIVELTRNGIKRANRRLYHSRERLPEWEQDLVGEASGEVPPDEVP